MNPIPLKAAIAYAVSIAWMLAGLSGCGSGDGKKPASQIAVQVNKQEISVHQLNFMLTKLGQLAPEQANEAKRAVLGRLVDQELLVQKANEIKLERNPDVLQAIEAARREILADAYLQQVTAAASKSSAEEIHAYYTSHPELFSGRKIYRLREYAISGSPEQLAAVKAQVGTTDSIDAMVAWLKERQIPFRQDAGVKSAEQVPLNLLSRLYQARDGEVVTFVNTNGILLVQIQATQPQPVDLAAATPAIEAFLLAEKRKALAAAELKKLKDAAAIEYRGEFATAEAAQAATRGEPAPVSVTPPAGAGTSTTAAPKPNAPPSDAEAIAKGLKALK